MNDIAFLTASQMASAILDKKISSREIIEALIKQADIANPIINAVVTIDADNALKKAEQADNAISRGDIWGPLHGVPVTIKDVFETEGIRTTSGHMPFKNKVPKRDASVVSKLRKAGAIIFGKTNTPELAFGPECYNPVYGLTNNPWDFSRSPGGSSGGSAAAVAAGMSPIDIGSDIAGSIRLPAHFCGVYGIKPTDHLVSSAGHIPGEPWGLLRHLVSSGPIARSIEDLNISLKVISGEDGRQWEIPPACIEKFREKPLEELKIAITEEVSGIPVSSEILDMLGDVKDKLLYSGCKAVDAIPLKLDWKEAIFLRSEIESTAEHTRSTPFKVPRPVFRLLSKAIYDKDPMTAGYFKGIGANISTYSRALSRRDRFIRKIEDFFKGYDAWILPAASIPAFEHHIIRNHLDLHTINEKVNGKSFPIGMSAFGYTSIFNLTGNPAISMPCGITKNGLPAGIQLAGKRWDDFGLLSIAEKISGIIGGYRRPPGF